ncbi:MULTISPECIES: PH domain-containing protein [unclassified Micromonospora]|uniref:PH domain-containing protein n=1 Tax=unclassified Micromonospora TaxID=2617518 RepID=UPI001B365AD8|nr:MULTISPECIES: PH domain-containing protein [unclassified Micromonospora]MBQ1043966.1 PH domain-containing protein [Micromonospora sp. C72]MBQ1054743.1 PH domain-containing protein [Micromonospora sp. C32]
MTVWRRLYSLDLTTFGAISGVVGTVGYLGFFVFAAVSGMMSGPEAAFFGVWFVPGLVVAARRAMLGVWVSPVGIRSRSLLRTTTVPWASVVDIHSGASSIMGLDMGRDAIVIERTDGEPVQTPIQSGAIVRPFRLELFRLVTWPEHYDEILANLRECHREARPPEQRAAVSPAPDPVRVDRRDRTRPPASSAGRRRDIHALTRQYERGVLTEVEYAAELARLRGDE